MLLKENEKVLIKALIYGSIIGLYICILFVEPSSMTYGNFNSMVFNYIIYVI